MLAEPAGPGVDVRFEALPAPSLPDARIHALRLPTAVEPGAPLSAALEWSLDSGAEGAARWSAGSELKLVCDYRDASGASTSSTELAWPDDASIQRLTIPLGVARSGAIVLRARLELRGPGALRSGDPLPENDVAEAASRVGDARVALAVAPESELDALRAWLDGATPGIDWIVRTPRALDPLPTDLDLVCTFDLAADRLPHATIEAVLARGGGWFRCGGWSWLERPRGPEASRVAAWSPLEAADPSGPPVERLFLVDGSGSMRGEPFAAVRRALEGLLPLVADADRVVLQLFSNALGPRVILAEANERADEESLARLRAVDVRGGATEILDCLDVVGRSRLDAPVERATVVLLSDGREDDALRPAERAERIRESFRATHRELSALAAGPAADESFLSLLVGPGGRLARAEDFDELTELFREEVGAERTLEGDAARALPARPDEPAEARALADAFRVEVQ
ncbi:MAG: VWA domain-containing protein, partial [Planctomycetes bacterium]|nr:VWA domain-containing protein [Planctomycetota bacterium]